MMSHQSEEQSTAQGVTVEFVCAFAASLFSCTFTFFIHLLKPHEFDILVYIKFMIMALVAYFTVALILNKFWVGSLRRLLPNWIPISVFGSTFFVIIRLLPAVVSGWSGTDVTEPSLAKFIMIEIDAARSVVIILSMITLPVTALIYYSKSIIRALKRWHDSSELPPSITPPSA